ncbi:c-type cytochrome [Roseivivax sp. CAU 1761]
MRTVRALSLAVLTGSIAAQAQAQAHETGEPQGPPLTRAADHYQDQAAAADLAGIADLVSGEDGEETVWSCASCHGAEGEGTGLAPRLAGLQAGYIAKQLYDFRQGLRQNANMAYVSRQLSPEQILGVAAFYERQWARPSSSPDLAGDLQRGRELAQEGAWQVGLPACFSCHGPSGWGAGAAFPAIAGQHAAYLAAQIQSWKSGARRNSPIGLMKAVADLLSDEEIAAVADYLASLPPPQPVDGKPLTLTGRESDG